MNVTKKPVVALFAAVLMVAAGSAVLLGSFRQMRDAAALRRQSLVVLSSANELLSSVTDAETGQRGYLLTGDETFLDPYLAVRDSIAVRLGALRRLSADSAARRDLDALAPLLKAKLAGMAHVIELRRSGDVAGAQSVVLGGAGKRMMDSIRVVMRTVTATEAAALARNDEALNADLRRLLVLIIATSLLALACAVAFAYWTRQRVRQQLADALHLETEQSLDTQEAANVALQQINATLAESEERFEVTLASIGDAVMTTDASARVSGLNPIAEKLTGWTAAQAAGQQVSEVFRIINKETRQPATIPVAETLAHGTVHGLANHTVLIARDGSERDIADSCAPIRDRSGQVIGAVLVFRDVTAEYAVQQTLNDSSALIESVLATAADGIITFHASVGIVAKANPAAERIFGYPAAELIGKEFSLLVPELERDQLAHALEYYRPSEEARAKGLGREVMGRRKNGSSVPIELAVSEMMLAGERYFTAIVRDITARKEAEAALLRAGPLQSAIFNSANFSSIATDAKGVIQIFNVGAERMLGYAASDVMNKITPADISDPREVIARAQALSAELGTPIAPGFEALVFKASRGIEDIYELTYIRKDGSRFPAVVSVTALRDADDTIIGYLLIGTDNTARKLAEAALLKAGALQNAIFNSANFSSIATDARGVIQIFNVGAERMLGYTAAEVMNRITPADISDPQEVIARARALSAELGTPITPGFEALVFKASRGIEDIYELTYIRKDGSRFPAVVSVTALRDADDAIIGYLLIGTDNTARQQVEEERKKLDQRLRDQQFYTRSLIESNIDAIMTTDPSGIITDINTQMEALTGCTRDELIGAPFKKFFTDPERAEAAISLALNQKQVTNYELTARAFDGRETVVSYNATTFYDRDRRLQGVFAAARDVTEPKRVEAELEQAKALAESANRTKSDFLASMSHEIRTPMTAIMGIADLLSKTPLSDEQDKYVRIFRRAGDNLLNLVNDILDLSKVEASQLELEQTGFALPDLLEKVTELVAGRAQEKELALTCEIAPGVPGDLLGDPTRLQQVLLNLLGNAIKFTESGSVSLRVSLESGSESQAVLRFTIADTGIGIPDENLGRVFERFTQADSSTTRRFGGSGLGLTISKRLVELMGGHIWAESTVGQGSVFCFAVPFAHWEGILRRAGEPRSARLELSLPALRILLVEDSADNCVITVAYLADTPYMIEIAENGAIACEMFAAGKYDLILMDRQMPVMDGVTATRTIRALEKSSGRPPTPIIALTASALKGDREQFLAAGCTEFLTKPIKQESLLHAIRDCSHGAPAWSSDQVVQDLGVIPPANALLAARVPQFLQNRRKDVTAMRDALAREDWKTVERLGHNMRGTGAGYGFQAITDLGESIEREARRADTTASCHWVDELSTFLDRVGAGA